MWSSLEHFPNYLPQDLEESIETYYEYEYMNFTDYTDYTGSDYDIVLEGLNYTEPDMKSVSTEEHCLSTTINIFDLFFISTVVEDRVGLEAIKQVSDISRVYILLFKLVVSGGFKLSIREEVLLEYKDHS